MTTLGLEAHHAITLLIVLLVALALLRLGLPLVIHAFWRAPREREALTPAELGLPFREATIPSVGGKRLCAWFIPAAAARAPALVLLHGWGGNAQSLLPLARLLHQAGFSLLLPAARNHGRSDGDRISSMVTFAEDLDHALAWLQRQPEAASVPIGVVGHSVGAAAALLCASRRDDLAVVVSIAAFAHPGKLMASMMARRGIPSLLGGWMLRHIERAIGARYDTIAPITTIARIRAPVLLVHGTDDEQIPVADAHAIYARRAADTTRLLLVPGRHQATGALRSHGAELVAFLAAGCGIR